MKKLFSVVLSVMMATMVLFTTFAANAAAEYPAVNAAGTTVTFTKQLNVPNYVAGETSTPTFNFTYSITEGAAVAATATSPEIKAGVTGETVGNAQFTNADITATTNDKSVTMDFSACNFTDPGIYRYILTENANTNTATGVDGAVTYDTNTYYVDVYVIEDTTTNPATLKIADAVMYKSSTVPSITMGTGNTAVYADADTKKVDTIENTYDVYDLDLTKTVTGAMGEKNKDFPFTITFANGPKNVTLNADVNGTATTIAFDANGAASISINLKDGESASVFALPKGTTYTIEETMSAADKASYDVTITGAGSTTDDYTGTGSMTADTAIDYTNNRDRITPTGLFMMYGPYVLMIAVAGALALVFFSKKRNAREADLFA